MQRIPATERTREKLRDLLEGRSEVADGRSELVRLAARLIIEETLEGEARDALGRDYYARGATPGTGYRNGYLGNKPDQRDICFTGTAVWAVRHDGVLLHNWVERSAWELYVALTQPSTRS